MQKEHKQINEQENFQRTINAMRNNSVHYSKSGGKRQDSLERQQLRGLQIDYSTSPRTSQGEIIPSMQTADAKAFKFKCTLKKAKSRTSRESEISLKKHFGRAPTTAVQGTGHELHAFLPLSKRQIEKHCKG